MRPTRGTVQRVIASRPQSNSAASISKRCPAQGNTYRVRVPSARTRRGLRLLMRARSRVRGRRVAMSPRAHHSESPECWLTSLTTEAPLHGRRPTFRFVSAARARPTRWDEKPREKRGRDDHRAKPQNAGLRPPMKRLGSEASIASRPSAPQAVADLTDALADLVGQLANDSENALGQGAPHVIPSLGNVEAGAKARATAIATQHVGQTPLSTSTGEGLRFGGPPHGWRLTRRLP